MFGEGGSTEYRQSASLSLLSSEMGPPPPPAPHPQASLPPPLWFGGEGRGGGGPQFGRGDIHCGTLGKQYMYFFVGGSKENTGDPRNFLYVFFLYDCYFLFRSKAASLCGSRKGAGLQVQH